MTAPRLAPGEIVGRRYTIGAELGRGELSATYAAVTAHDRQVALRILDPDQPSLIARVERLRQTGEATRELPPDLVGTLVVGRDVTSGAPFVVTPFALWPSLEAVTATTRQAPRELVTLAANLAGVLDVLRGAGVAHLGLKPSNVFVGPAPELAVQLVDAGIPAALRHPGAAGPLAWLAPEQLDAPDGGTHASDVFTSALLLFHALTGASLFASEDLPPFDPARWREEIARAPSASDRARELGVDLPRAIDDVLRRATALEPADRHATATELAERLADALGETRRAFAVAPPTDPQPFADPDGAAVAPSSSALPPPSGPGGDGEYEGPAGDVEERAPSIDPRETPGLISLLTRAAPPAATLRAQPSIPDTDEAGALAAGSPLERLPFDAALVQPRPPVSRRTLLILGAASVAMTLLGLAVIAVVVLRPLVPKSDPASVGTTVVAPDAPEPPKAPIPSPPASASAGPVGDAPPPASSAPESALRAGEGELSVVCEPACVAVAIDGAVQKHESPFVLRAGGHAIGVSRPGFTGGWKRVDVVAGERTTVSFDLVPSKKKKKK